jgi:hypothetical protein
MYKNYLKREKIKKKYYLGPVHRAAVVVDAGCFPTILVPGMRGASPVAGLAHMQSLVNLSSSD